MNIIPYQVMRHRQGFNSHRHEPGIVVMQSSHQDVYDAREVELCLAVSQEGLHATLHVYMAHLCATCRQV